VPCPSPAGATWLAGSVSPPPPSTRHLAPIVARLARRRPVTDAVVARALRQVFDDRGGSFAKFGQLIGSSPSLFGEDVAAEFRSTLDDVVPVPFAEVKTTIEDELGLPLSHLFTNFEETPIAAASLAVVHRATLPDGTTVAVKVLRPGIEARMAVDLAVMRPLFGVIGRSPSASPATRRSSAASRAALREVDLRNEAPCAGSST
jgi:predicted unusual protein kinase regulating ubiquinone biosynthesis (AarF/ABC1/UbiB family)